MDSHIGNPHQPWKTVSKARSTPNVKPLIRAKPRKLGATTEASPNGKRVTTAAQKPANLSANVRRLVSVCCSTTCPECQRQVTIKRPKGDLLGCAGRERRGQTPVRVAFCLIALNI